MEAPDYYRLMATAAAAEAEAAANDDKRAAWLQVSAKWLALGQDVEAYRVEFGVESDSAKSVRIH